MWTRMGSEVILRTPKWNSLHLIFIFLNNGEMMPIIYASCIAKWENKHGFVGFFCKYVVDGFDLKCIWKNRLSLDNRSTFTNLYL